MLLRTRIQLTTNASRHILLVQADAVVRSILQLLSRDLGDLLAARFILTQSNLHRLAISQYHARELLSYFKAASAV